VITRHSVGDQKQIFGGIGQDHVQKAAANNRYNANQSMLDAEQAYNALLHIVPAAMLFAALGIGRTAITCFCA
jgi:hypothetical protein